MVQSKEFSSEAQRTYYLVAKNQAKINVNNFGKLKEFQPNKENSLELRNMIGRSLLEALKQNDFPALTQRQEKAFLETPYEFAPKLHPQSSQSRIVERYKDIMMVVNEFFVGHYPVSLELQNFLITRNNDLFSKNKKVLEDSKIWVNGFKEQVSEVKKQIDSDIPVKDFSVSKLRKANTNLLVRIISGLSKALDETKEFFGEKMIEKADDLLVLFDKSKAEPIDVPRDNPLMITESEKVKQDYTPGDSFSKQDEQDEEEEDEEDDDGNETVFENP